MNLLALKQALKPADSDHRYGHGKIEGLAALFQAAFIMGAAVFVLLEAVKNLADPKPVTDHWLAVGIMIASIALTAILTWIQTKGISESGSVAVEADRGPIYTGDIITHTGVIIALLGNLYGGPSWLDPLIAIAITVYLGHMGWHIGCKGVDILLDRELPGDAREKILQNHPDA